MGSYAAKKTQSDCNFASLVRNAPKGSGISIEETQLMGSGCPDKVLGEIMGNSIPASWQFN